MKKSYLKAPSAVATMSLVGFVGGCASGSNIDQYDRGVTPHEQCIGKSPADASQCHKRNSQAYPQAGGYDHSGLKAMSNEDLLKGAGR